MKTVKVSITLPEDLYHQIKGLTSNISAFIAEGMHHYLARVRAERAIEESAGAWAAESHPELGDLEKIADYVHEVRTGWRRENG
ncbi:MAG: type II toxin-antitoxin system CcdA family antitoxin [Moorellaceae bacterium]